MIKKIMKKIKTTKYENKKPKQNWSEPIFSK
jgi:hypothetical protein